MNLLALVLVSVLLILAVRAGLRRWRRSTPDHRPGFSEATARPVTSYREVDAFADAARCRCGGQLRRLGESLRGDRFRIVRTTCVSCGRENDLFFALPQLLH